MRNIETTSIKPNQIMAAAHQMAREDRECWPEATYAELLRAALKALWAAYRNTQAKVSKGIKAACIKGIQGCVRAFQSINSRRPETIKAMLHAAANKGLTVHCAAYLQYAQQHRAEVLNNDLIRAALLNAGGRIWDRKGHRIYISRIIRKVVTNYDSFGRRGQYECDKMYYDCDERCWCNVPANVIWGEGFAA